MKNKLNPTGQMKTLIALVMTITALFGSLAPTLRAQSGSAPNSPNSATRADDDALRKACAEAVEELRAARKLLEANKTAFAEQEQLLRLEREISAKLKNINVLSDSEKTELRKALAARDRQIAALDAANRVLKKQKFTVWKAVKVGLVAAAAGIIVGKVF